MKVYSVQNEKGGCGKSTTSINLAFGLAQKGLRVLAVDNDPQSNLTSVILKLSKEIKIMEMLKLISMTDTSEMNLDKARNVLHEYVDKTVFKCDISDVLNDPSVIKDAIIKSAYENLWVVPSSHKLSESDMKLKNAMRNADGRLRSALDKVQNDFDVVIIDNSPFENALTYNSISACYREGDTIIIPTKIDQGGLEGLDHTISTMIEWLEYGDLEYDFKILCTMVNKNNTDKTVITWLKQIFQNRVFDICIHYQAKPVVEASISKDILINVSKEHVALDYIAFVNEVYSNITKESRGQ
ncbi:MAG: AAA family ATPase [Erysipelotrichaceae bacterium]